MIRLADIAQKGAGSVLRMALFSPTPTPRSWLVSRDLALRVISGLFTTTWKTCVVGCRGKADSLIPVVLMIVGGKSFTANLLGLFRLVRPQPPAVPFLVSVTTQQLFPARGESGEYPISARRRFIIARFHLPHWARPCESLYLALIGT